MNKTLRKDLKICNSEEHGGMPLSHAQLRALKEGFPLGAQPWQRPRGIPQALERHAPSLPFPIFTPSNYNLQKQ